MKDLRDVVKDAANLCNGKEYKPAEEMRQVMIEEIISHNVQDMSYRMLSTSYELLLNWNISATL